MLVEHGIDRPRSRSAGRCVTSITGAGIWQIEQMMALTMFSLLHCLLVTGKLLAFLLVHVYDWLEFTSAYVCV